MRAKAANDVALAARCGEELDSVQHFIYRHLCYKSHEQAFNADDVCLRELAIVQAPGQPNISIARCLLILIITQQVEYFNVGKTMNRTQVAALVDDIMDCFPYMSPAEVSTAFSIWRRTAQVYDRLDPNVMLQALREYDRERDGFCERSAYTAEGNTGKEPAELLANGNVMTLDEYGQWLDAEVAKGNEEAIKMKEAHDYVAYRRGDAQRKEADFQAWRKSVGA